MTVLDVETVRRDTPACRDVAHFNNAGAALMPDVVVERVVAHLRSEQAIGGYEAEKQAARRLAASVCRVTMSL